MEDFSDEFVTELIETVRRIMTTAPLDGSSNGPTTA